MKKYQRIIAGGLILGSLVGFIGCCEEKSESAYTPTPLEIYNPYDDGAHTISESGICVALGDVDGDKLIDLIAGSPSSIKYFKNIGDGRFKEEQNVCSPYNDGIHTGSSSGIGVALGDVDGDGDLDLIVASPSHVRIYTNTNGRFNLQLK